MRIGYARVSTEDQNLDMQLNALRDAGCERVYDERASGKNTDWPEFKRMLDALREGDTVVVYKLDRISRSVQDLESLMNTFREMRVEFASICDQIDTSTPTGRFFFHMIGAVAELERDVIVDRTKTGLAAARARGRVGGRKPVDTKTVTKMLALYDSKQMTVPEICEECGISKGTLYKYVNERKAKEKGSEG